MTHRERYVIIRSSKHPSVMSRDEKNQRELLHLGWKVIIIWECELKKDKKSDTLECLVRKLEQ